MNPGQLAGRMMTAPRQSGFRGAPAQSPHPCSHALQTSGEIGGSGQPYRWILRIGHTVSGITRR
jgi:hypothetical protein